jgi:hypothetical protein
VGGIDQGGAHGLIGDAPTGAEINLLAQRIAVHLVVIALCIMTCDIEPLVDCYSVRVTKITNPRGDVNTTGHSKLKVTARNPNVCPAIKLILQSSHGRWWRAGAFAACLETKFLVSATGAKALACVNVVLAEIAIDCEGADVRNGRRGNSFLTLI